MQLPNSNNLEIKYLQRIFDNMSECYKLFWFKAILEYVHNGNTEILFDELIDEMISSAWYMVAEYKLNLGPSDTLEMLVAEAKIKTGIKSSEKKEKIISGIKDINDPEINKKKLTLTYNVPYRLQAPFLDGIKGKEWNVSSGKLSEKINEYDNTIYKIKYAFGLKSVVVVNENWASYLRENYEILLGWIQYNMVIYLQKRNPSVPGISSKLFPPQERKLTKVIKLWKGIFEVSNVKDIYGLTDMTNDDISIDHFIPWSYVAHDELWNLNPTTRSINSKKSNNLPDWNSYFNRLCNLEYSAYKTIWENDEIHKLFDECAKEHINNNEIKLKLYSPNILEDEYFKNLEEVILPIYNAAASQGFDNWRLS